MEKTLEEKIAESLKNGGEIQLKNDVYVAVVPEGDNSAVVLRVVCTDPGKYQKYANKLRMGVGESIAKVEKDIIGLYRVPASARQVENYLKRIEDALE
jgi:hypothetical protein